MLRRSSLIYVFCFIAVSYAYSQTDPPVLGSWLRNTMGETGYNSLPANVQSVKYTADTVYISSTGIPAYNIGPWGKDPNTPSNQHYVFEIPRAPAQNTDTITATPLGPTGFWINGVPVFNALDANSYNNQNVWHSNAVVVEGSSFDACNGHPAPGGAYHHHENPICLYTADSAQHSPLLGYAFDGIPIYGPYGYAHSASGGVTRLRSSFRLRNITERTTLPNGTALQSSQYGPVVSSMYPLGYYVEDFEYIPGLGDLDNHNGHITVTPDYPNGIYAYVVTIDSTGASAYPYTIGPTYYGNVAMENINSHAKVQISDSAVVYSPASGVDEQSSSLPPSLALNGNYPNPFSETTTISYIVPQSSRVELRVYNTIGEEIATLMDGIQSAGIHIVTFTASNLQNGIYFCRLAAGTFSQTVKMNVMH